jgi:hypothetical protein
MNSDTETNGIQKKEIVDKYVGLLKRLKQEIPELDDVQIYTFDQGAWIASEFGEGPTDRDIPLHERIPTFLGALTAAWAEVSPDGILWWEPWELSAGQIFACVPQLPAKNFGMLLHSNLAEVQLSRPVDLWFRNMVFLLAERNIPVVGEIFMGSASEPHEPLQFLATPRLTAEQIDALAQFSGSVSGVKEYYGLIPERYDPNIAIVGLKFNNPAMSNREALQKMAEPFGKNAAEILRAWELSSQGMGLFPCDATWQFLRMVRAHQVNIVCPRWNKARIYGEVADSPSWMSTRRGLFMTTENTAQHPWFFEDIELRCAASSAKFLEAIEHFERIDLSSLDKRYADYVTANISDLRRFEQIVTSVRCYCRECNLAFLMRKYAVKGEAIPDALIKRFEDIMAIDIANQSKPFAAKQGDPTAAEMLELFRKDPAKWVTTYLLP